jgi:hypothetical protein
VNEPRDEDLSRAYRGLDRSEPPQRLDDAILAASRREAGARPRSTRPVLLRFWDNPIALAATVVLTFSLSLMVFEQLPQSERALEESPRASAPPNEAPASRAEEPAADSARGARQREAAKPAAPATPAKDAAARLDSRRDEPSAERKLEQNRGFVPDAQQLKQRAEAEAPRAPERSLYKSEPAAAAPAQAQPAPTSPQAEPMPQAVPPASGARLQFAPAPGAQISADSAANTVSGGIATSSALSKQRSPEEWIKTIRQLKAEGKAADVDRELAEFKKRYPEYRLPDDLR